MWFLCKSEPKDMVPMDLEQSIQQMMERVEGENHYEILGITQNASALEISRAFRALVGTWHIDKFGASGLSESALNDVRTIFQRINDAHRVLGNESSRKAYDESLSGTLGVQEALDVENQFLRGQRALYENKIQVAKGLFDTVSKRVPDNPNYRMHKLYVDYLLMPKTQDGLAEDQEACQAIYQEMTQIKKDYTDPIDWVHEYFGMVALGLGEKVIARSNFKRAVELNANNSNAQMRLRLMERRQHEKHEQQPLNGSGFLGFFKNLFRRKGS